MTGEYPSRDLLSFIHSFIAWRGRVRGRAALLRGMWLRMNDETPLKDVMRSGAGGTLIGDG